VVPYLDPTPGFFDYRCHDLGELQLLWKALRPGMVFLDVGADHGVYSIVVAKKLGHRGAVVAFEPSSKEYRRLRHVRQNRLCSARTEPLAVRSATSARPFFRITSGDTPRGAETAG
jgi:predicted methyltransferase